MRGKVPFEVAGQEYALRFTNNRLCQLEEDSGESITALFARLEDQSAVALRDMRMMFRAGLEGEFTLEQAGDLIDEVGVKEVGQLVFAALAAAFKLTVVEGGKAGKPKAGTV